MPKWVLDAEGAPLPRNGGYFAIFKPKGQKNFFANVVLPDGHKEKWDSNHSDRYTAIGVSRTYVKVLCKQRGVLTLKEKREKKNELSKYHKTQANNAARAAGQPIPYPDPRGYRDSFSRVADHADKPRRGRPPGPKTATNGQAALVPIVASPTEDDAQWKGFIRRHEERCVVFFHRVSELFIVEAHTDPQVFIEHVRAMVVESYENSFRRPRGRPPG